jgi:hypothetical protein
LPALLAPVHFEEAVVPEAAAKSIPVAWKPHTPSPVDTSHDGFAVQPVISVEDPDPVDLYTLLWVDRYT